jgi:DNA-binding CsgD family transcriptional regulator
MAAVVAGAEVVGRTVELDAIDAFLADRQSQLLVLEGVAGIGKTTLWTAAVERARVGRVEVWCARPAAAEASLSLAGLGDLLGALPAEVREELPEAQRHALAVALAEEDAVAGDADGHVVGVAVLGVLRTVAAQHPLLLAIDDLQWLDEASGRILVYALRRLGAANVRLLASCRGEPGVQLPFGLHQAFGERVVRVAVGPLSEGAIARLLRLRLGVALTRVQLHALYDAAQGNPFFALELVRAGWEMDASGAIRLPRSMQELVADRLRALPAPTRDGLLYVAALADARDAVLERAHVRDDLEAALAAGVLDAEGGRLRFTHPLIASAVWSSASEQRRRDVHRALADCVEDSEQRARHRAATASSPDPEVADLLEEAAAGARGRGAPGAAAEMLERALQLAPSDEIGRWARLAASAAGAHGEAGHWGTVRELVEQAQSRLPPGVDRAAVLVAAAELSPGLGHLFRQAVAEAGETPIAIRAWIGLSEQATLAGRWEEAIAACKEAGALARRLGEHSFLGVALTFLGGNELLAGRPEGMDAIAQAVAIEQEMDGLPTSVYESPRMWQAAAHLWSDEVDEARVILDEGLATAVEVGDDMSAFQFKQLLLLTELHAGEWEVARAISDEALEQVESFGYDYGRSVLLAGLSLLAAHEGDLAHARALGSEAVSTLEAMGDRLWSTYAHAALLLTELSAADLNGALTHADAISERFRERECWWVSYQGDEIEALVLAGEHERALARVDALRRDGALLNLPRFLAWADRGEGLVHVAQGDLDAARTAIETALAHHERFSHPFERGRTLLAYGHVLRRQRHRRDARVVLEEALGIFERLGAAHFAEAARGELKHVGGRAPVGEHELTAAEGQIARLVAAGRSNKEVAAQLFVTVSTVEATLTRVYDKLGLTSRSQLARALPEVDSAASGAARESGPAA